jgi:uncharacterized protein YjbJ (UPF0337 family)
MNTLEIKGNWNIIKGTMKQKWAQLTDDDLVYVDGKQDELVGRIQKRTGESRQVIEEGIMAACVLVLAAAEEADRAAKAAAPIVTA